MNTARGRLGLRDHWPLAVATVALLARDAPLLAMRALALNMDGIRLYYPAEHALAQALARATLPFWTPLLQAGFPLLGEGQPGALYPLNLVAFAVLPTPVAHNAIVLVHRYLGLGFTYWWGRTLHLGAPASALMALAFVLTTWLGGSTVVLIETATWIPALFALAERRVHRAPSGAWVAAPVFAVQWLAGFPQIALYTVLATSLYVLMRAGVEGLPWRRRAALMAAWGAAAIVGTLAAAPQLLPQYELSRFSIRAGGIVGNLGGERSLFPGALITLVMPSWRGFVEMAALGTPIYCGVLPCTVAVAVLLGGTRTRWLWPVAIVGGAALIFSLGQYSPLFPIIRRLPGLAYFRSPSRAMVFVQFALVTLFALGWDDLSRRTMGRFVRALRVVLGGTAGILVLNGVAAPPLLHWLRPRLLAFAEQYTRRYILTDPYHLQPWAYYEAKIEALLRSVTEAVTLSRAEVAIPLGIAAGAYLVLRTAAVHPWRRAIAAALIAVDLFVVGRPAHSHPEAWLVTQEPRTARLLRAQPDVDACRTFWVADAGLVPYRAEVFPLLIGNYNLLWGVGSTGVYAALGFHTYQRLMEPLGTVDLGFGFRPVAAENVERARPLLDLINACYVLSRVPLSGFTPLAELEGVFVYRNDQALPRAFVVDQVERVASTDAALAWMRAHPERLKHTAVVTGPTVPPVEPGVAARARTRTVSYADREVTVEVAAQGAALLILTDSDYPGWRAEVDGQPAIIHRSYAAFRAVGVPAGEHTVRFIYEPHAFWRGLGLSGAAAALLGAWLVVCRFGRSLRKQRLSPLGREREHGSPLPPLPPGALHKNPVSSASLTPRSG